MENNTNGKTYFLNMSLILVAGISFILEGSSARLFKIDENCSKEPIKDIEL